MPRLTNTEYLIRQEILKRVWKVKRGDFGYLSFQQQRDLHDYFAASKELTDEELLEHRQDVSKLDPSLPHRASKAFLAFLRPPKSMATSRVTVRPIVRPEMDFLDLAEALLDFVDRLPAEERERFAQQGAKFDED